jgi:EmrB/QacA subfamily drug resistance transporter
VEYDRTTKRAALLIAAASSFLTPFMGSAVNVAVPTIGRDLGIGAVALGWVATSYLLAAAMFLLPLGRFADIHGRKRMFLTGLTVYGATSALCGLANSESMLIGFRVLQGAGVSMIFGTSMAILTSVYPPGERGQALGITVASVYTGLAVGPYLGGLLTEYLTWRSVFLVNAPVALILVVVAARQLKGEWADARGERFDRVGALLYSVSLPTFMYGLSRLPGATGSTLALGGVAGLAAFAFWESRTHHALLNVRLLIENRVFACSNLAALLNYSASFGSGFLLSMYLQYLHGLSPKQAGLVLLAQPVMMAVFSPLAGRLSDRSEPRIIASIGMALTALALAALSWLSEGSSLEFVVGCLVVLGLGFALFSSPNANAIMSSVEQRLLGVASGMVGTMRLTGQMFSMGVVMWMLSTYVGQRQITPELHGAFLDCTGAAYTLLAGLCAAGVLASLARGNLRSVEKT